MYPDRHWVGGPQRARIELDSDLTLSRTLLVEVLLCGWYTHLPLKIGSSDSDCKLDQNLVQISACIFTIVQLNIELLLNLGQTSMYKSSQEIY